MAEFRDGARVATVSKRRGASSDKKSLGTVHEQRFYAVRDLPGSGGRSELTFPFNPKPFNALIRVNVPLSEAAGRQLGLSLLRHGLRQAVCCGCEAEAMGEMLDELADEYGFHQNGRPAFASVHEDEPLEEVIDYFILPNGLADVGLLVIVGDEKAFRGALKSFAQVTGQLREALHAAL